MPMDKYQDIANGLTNDILIAVASGLSILGSILIISTYAGYREIRSFSRHIVVCISIADLLVASSNCFSIIITPVIDSQITALDKTACTLQSFVGTTAVLWSFLWTMTLALYLYIDLVRGNQQLGKAIIWPWAHLVCWILPLAINIAALLLNKLGNSGDRNTSGWCWISVFVDDYDDAKLWMLIDGKGIELFTYIIIILLYSRMKCSLWKKIPKESENSHLLEKVSYDAARYTDAKLVLIPLLFILLRIWGTIRFFMLLRTPELRFSGEINKYQIILIYMQTVGDNLQGAINCFLFCCMTPVVRKRLNKTVKSMRRQRFYLHDNFESTSDTTSRVYQSIE